MKTLKLKHTLKLEWKTISGKITDVIWNDNKRGDGITIYNKDRTLRIVSLVLPELFESVFYVWGNNYGDSGYNDDGIVIYTYDTEEQAQKMYDFIMEHTKKDEKELEYVLVRYSEENEWEKRILLHTLPWNTHKYICLDKGYEMKYKMWERYEWNPWTYMKKIEETEDVTFNLTQKERKEVEDFLKKIRWE